MSYNIDRSLIADGVFSYKTEAGCHYLANISETANGSGLWTLDFVKVSGESDPIEVFKVMKTLTDNCMQFAKDKNIKNVIIFISGNTEKEIEQKTKAFERWIKLDWNYEIVKDLEIKIPGLRNGLNIIPTNSIFMTRKEVVEIPESKLTGVDIKFCYNCGTENGGWQFCPTCGTNLKQN